jgi:hypothetical protein
MGVLTNAGARRSAERRTEMAAARVELRDPDKLEALLRDPAGPLVECLVWDLLIASRADGRRSLSLRALAERAAKLGHCLLLPLAETSEETREWVARNGTMGMRRADGAARRKRRAYVSRAHRAGLGVKSMGAVGR